MTNKKSVSEISLTLFLWMVSNAEFWLMRYWFRPGGTLIRGDKRGPIRSYARHSLLIYSERNTEILDSYAPLVLNAYEIAQNCLRIRGSCVKTQSLE